METKPAAQDEQFYEDFEPFCQWTKKEFDILEIHLPDFRRQDIRVQHNLDILTISGQQPRVDKTTSAALPSRFRKEIKISKNFTTDQISAKFSDGILSITIPKKARCSAWSSVKDNLVCLRSKVLRPQLSKKTAVTAAAVVLVIALGVYAVSRYPKSASFLNAFDLRKFPSNQVP